MRVELPDSLAGEAGRKLVEATHAYCPYSKATRGNIDVELGHRVAAPRPSGSHTTVRAGPTGEHPRPAPLVMTPRRPAQPVQDRVDRSQHRRAHRVGRVERLETVAPVRHVDDLDVRRTPGGLRHELLDGRGDLGALAPRPDQHDGQIPASDTVRTGWKRDPASPQLGSGARIG